MFSDRIDEMEDTHHLIATDPLKQRLILFSISFASFMVNLDTYIVNISLPNISHYFNSTSGEVSWVVLSYNLTVASLLIIIGRLGDRIGLKKLFLWGFGIFTLSSLLCGKAPDLLTLIIGRCIQGIGASMLYAMTPAMVPRFLPEKMRGPAFGTLATAAALGITVGTPLGGLITGYFTWHWIFLINLPVGLIAIVVSYWILPREPAESLVRKEGAFDMPGALLSFVSSLAFIYAISMGDERGWVSPVIISCLASSAVSLYLFVAWERRCRAPILDMTLFRDLAFSYGNIAGGLACAFLAGNNFLMPFYLMLVKGLKAQQAGSVFMIYSIIYMIVGPLSGAMSSRMSPRILCTAAMAFATCFVLAFSWVLSTSSFVPVILYFVCMALAYGTFFPANNTVVMGMAPPGKQGVVSGVYRMVNRLGMAIGVCFFETAFALFATASGHPLTGDYSTLPRDLLVKGFQVAYVAGGFVCLLAFLTSFLARARESLSAEKENQSEIAPKAD